MNKQNLKKNLFKYGPILLILIPLFFGIFLRLQPADLPITDNWAKDTVHNSMKNQLQSQLRQQYPNLPSEQLNNVVDDEFQKQLTNNDEQVQNQIDQVSDQFKAAMQTENGQTYLQAIDPWLFYGYAKYYVENGDWGEPQEEGKPIYPYRNGRIGKPMHFQMLPAVNVMTHKIWSFFDSSVSVMKSTFYVPVFLFILTIIFAYLIGFKLFGHYGAAISSTILAVHVGLLRRTSGGFTDTDNLIIFFEMMVLMFFTYAFTADKSWKRYLFSGLVGLGMAMYAKSHSSWWHMFDMLGAVLVISTLYVIWRNRSELKKGIGELLKVINLRNKLQVLGLYVLSSSVIGTLGYMLLSRISLMQALNTMVVTPFKGPFTFLQLKDVGLKTVWPNVMTTVAELGSSNFAGVIDTIGGAPLLALSILGVVWLYFKGLKQNGETDTDFYLAFAVLLTLWIGSGLFAAQSSARFLFFLVPAFAFGFGALFEPLFNKLTGWAHRELKIHHIVTKSLVVVVFILLIWFPMIKPAFAVAESTVPSMNDAWYNSLIEIKEDSDDAIITSWWDFGHWFVSVAERRVTFDGGDQGERIHWVGKSLLTDSDQRSVGILRMLNCGQEKAPHVIEDLGYTTLEAVEILEEIVVQDRSEAYKTLEEFGIENPEVVLQHTHCEDLIPQYYIASDDMVSKGGVWGHFGSWNFTKSSMFNQVKSMKETQGIQHLIDNFGLDEKEAYEAYSEIRTKDGDDFIAPWPSFMGEHSCSEEGDILNCDNIATINQSDLRDFNIRMGGQGQGKPYSVVFMNDEGIQEHKFDNPDVPQVSAIITPFQDSFNMILADPMQATSVFTQLYYFQGETTDCFDLFSYKRSFNGNQIFVYKVDWQCEPNEE